MSEHTRALVTDTAPRYACTDGCGDHYRTERLAMLCCCGALDMEVVA